MTRRRTTIAVAIVALLVAGCGSDDEPDDAGGSLPSVASTPTVQSTTTAPPGDSSTPTNEPVEVARTDVVTGLELPWSVAFLPDDAALVSERDSLRILRIDPDGTVTEVQRLDAQAGGEGGLLGLAVSPTYDQDQFVYAYYSTADDNRVARFRLGEEPEPIVTGIPVGQIHNGGRLAFGPDGLLYITTGDAAESSASQDPESLGGKILRVRPDGTVPDDNPMPGSPVYSLGHRNVQGLAWTAEGQLLATEFGQNTWDEVNRIEPGGNYGWPEVEGMGGDPRYIDPITQWTTDEASPSGAVILLGGAIPQWEGDMFVAALRGERLWRLDLDEAGDLAGREPLYEGELGRLRAAAQAPDGSLWLLTSNRSARGEPTEGDDRIVRVGPPPG